MNDQQTLQFYSQLLLFKQDPQREVVIFPSTLTPVQRRTVHTIAHNMGLAHSSRGAGDNRQVHVYRSLAGSNVSPPIPALPTIQPAESSRRGLNRAATIDFSETRGESSGPYNTLRGHNSGFLNVLDSPGNFGNPQNLRAAKSFADLRSFTPSPVPSSASFPAALHQNGTRLHNYEGATTGSSNTPTLTHTPGAHGGMQPRADENLLVNSFGGLGLGPTVGGGNSGSPRRLRSMFSWEQQDPQPSTTAPIGSNRNMGVAYDSQSQERHPLRQPRGPTTEHGLGFRRPNGHQPRGSDEMRGNSGVEIIVE